ncbi:cytokine receptor common subunit beta-like isoform X2 [Centrocercus urophasianus]|uniref:cytokine receptor common subunit beta-like isoform X2 n=1 Tax=Centrocercus urophasianus TaxID=9002 RepID=UPI001C64EF2A|nr:cytokine receptor common subunit beta-like isoform X2 [Centrocercus urophasianus]
MQLHNKTKEEWAMKTFIFNENTISKDSVKMKGFFIFLLNLSLAFSDQAINESVPMESLRCHNDYSSLVTCTWKEHSEAHALLGLTLYQRNVIKNDSEEMHCQKELEEDLPEASDPYSHWICWKTVEYFGIGVDDYYSFKPKQNLEAQLQVHLFQNVQPLPPQNLSLRESSGDFLLTWTAPDGSQGLSNVLEYEVAYKRDWESWEKAASRLLSNITHCHLSHLIPGSRYIAHVRARPEQGTGFSGQYSEWSTDVSWETPEGGIHPRNLRCLFNGVYLKCSWEVKEAIASSVIFGLFFRATPASAEEECSPVYEKALPHVPYVVQSCGIPVSNISSQSQYQVSVRTKMEEKLIEAYKNIKVLPPANVSVELMRNQEYELRWKKHTLRYGFIKQQYEVQFWKHNQYEKTLKTIKITNDEPPFIFTDQMLSASTKYRGRMRAMVNNQDYQGYWSEWSEEFTWETENVLSPVVLPLMLPVLIITLLAVAYCSFKYLLRQKKLWEEKIPNPSKSLLIQSYLKKVPLGNRHASSQLDFNKCSLMENVDQPSFLQVVDRQKKILAESPEVQTERTEVSSPALDLQNPYHALNVPEHAPVVCPSPIPGYSYSVSRTNCADTSITSQTAITCFAFNGPYLYSPVRSSQPEMHQTLEVSLNPMGNQEKAVSLQYVTLPDKASPQAAQRQEQLGAGPLQPFLLPEQKEATQYLNKKEVSPLPSTCGKSTDMRREEQKCPEAPGCPAFLQQCPLEYITTDSLSLPSASGTTHLPLATAGGKPCDTQEPQPSSDCSCHEVSPEQFGVMLPPSGQVSASPEMHLDAFGDYLDVRSGHHGPSELSKISLPFQQKGSTLPKEQPLSEGNLVVLNPDSTEPVFLCQVGDYCFHSLKSGEKMHMSQEYPQIKKPSGGRTVPGKPVPDDEFITGKEGGVSKMQAIQLFKSLKSDDYFSWQQSLRITEIC